MQTFLKENKNGINEKQIEKVNKELEKKIELLNIFKQIPEEIDQLLVRENQDEAQEEEEGRKLYEKAKKIQSEFEEIEQGDQQKQLHLSDVEFGSEDSNEFEKDKTFGLGDQNGQNVEFSGSGTDQKKQTDNTDYDQYSSSSSNEIRSNTAADRNQSHDKYGQFIPADQQIGSDAENKARSSKNCGTVPNPPFINLKTLFLLKADMEKLKTNDKKEKESKNKDKSKERKTNSIDDSTAVQNDLSQMHVQTMKKLANVREEFCQKLNGILSITVLMLLQRA
ncbi:hypothetical protein niasHT_010541 [Heterodera trifolii]|uniref:Uncharacterized protein n=1 Tax=Heterodera trifolii TaxID=157864 RepID=A0ABD2L232_9BILA